MNTFIHQFVAGLANGGIYASIALALVMIHRSTHLLNFAQGEMAMFSTFIAWTLIQAGFGYWSAFAATVAASFAVGMIVERLVIRPIGTSSQLKLVVVFIGLLLIFNSVAGWIWTYDIRPFPSPFPENAKLLGGFLPATAVSWLGFVLFAILSNALCWPVMHRVFIPTLLWAVVILWIAPAVAALGLGIMVRVSMRVNTTQEAQQLGGAVVLPLVIVAVGQTTGLMLAGVWWAIGAGAVIWAVAILLNVRGAKAFTRDRMAARL